MGCRKLTYYRKEELGEMPFCCWEIETNREAGKEKRISEYRYGFNGMERDDEVKGTGNSYDFGARIQDPRLGRWLSLDPLAAKYPSMSPYNFGANNPIFFIDYDGRDIINPRKMKLSNKTLITKMKAFDLEVARLSGQDVHSYQFVISGGDRYKDANGKIYSASNDSPIPKSASKSQHLREEGATGVDLKFAEGISYEILEQAAENTGFRIDPSGKYDDHFHIDLKGSDLEMEYNSDDYVPGDKDFEHSGTTTSPSREVELGPKMKNFLNKMDNFNKKMDNFNEKLEKFNDKLEKKAAKSEGS
ncbi:MAG: RHS repeat-associated core domain-containing protein [Flavobacteriales bacterium]